MSIGEYLLRTRLSRRLDIADISQELHIRREYLEALERDEWDKLPGEVYGIGFLRTYARHLDVDADALVNYRRKLAGQQAPPPGKVDDGDGPAARRGPQRLRVPTAAIASEPAVRPTRAKSSRSSAPAGSGRVVLGAAVVLIILFVVGIFMMHNSPHGLTTADRSRGTAPPSPHSHQPKAGSSAGNSPSSSAAVVTLTSNNPQRGDLVYHVAGGPVHVTLAFTGLCWVEIWKNGVAQNAAGGTTYHAGQSVTLSASISVEVWLGTRAFQLSVDNQAISLPDPSQRVLHVTVQGS
jgi:transcriptional regulator with XRE-family HTH domain